jgi:hypothetical protein
MNGEKQCSECGAKMDASALSGLCPRCLLGLGDAANLEALADVDPETLGQVGQTSPGFVEQAGELIGRYKLIEKIGEGGFGSVWKAEQTEGVTRLVALKVIKLGMDTREVLARFEAERQALAMMEHPGIAKVFDAGATQAGRPFFVMELVVGVPVTQFCNEQKLDTPSPLRLFNRAGSEV